MLIIANNLRFKRSRTVRIHANADERSIYIGLYKQGPVGEQTHCALLSTSQQRDLLAELLPVCSTRQLCAELARRPATGEPTGRKGDAK